MLPTQLLWDRLPDLRPPGNDMMGETIDEFGVSPIMSFPRPRPT
jgi:hypothetical protein